VKIIKIDVLEVDPSKLLKLSVHFKRAQKELLAEKVETLQQFNDCMTFGFDYFQGYYFAKPMILQGKKLEASKMIIMHLLTLLVRNVDNAEIVRFIKRDVALSLTLLRLVNTPVYGFQKFIDSLGQALIVLGRRQLKRWLQILLFANTEKDRANGMSPLMILAATRGKMLELIAKMRPGRRKMSEMAFTVGIMSLVDALFGMSMETVLRQITVSTEIREALLRRTGFYGTGAAPGRVHRAARPDQVQMQRLLDELQLSADDFFAAEKPSNGATASPTTTSASRPACRCRRRRTATSMTMMTMIGGSPGWTGLHHAATKAAAFNGSLFILAGAVCACAPPDACTGAAGVSGRRWFCCKGAR
jgi:EAL and modified HD-GYP domain-containing signal transduction protein